MITQQLFLTHLSICSPLSVLQNTWRSHSKTTWPFSPAWGFSEPRNGKDWSGPGCWEPQLQLGMSSHSWTHTVKPMSTGSPHCSVREACKVKQAAWSAPVATSPSFCRESPTGLPLPAWDAPSIVPGATRVSDLQGCSEWPYKSMQSCPFILQRKLGLWEGKWLTQSHKAHYY